MLAESFVVLVVAPQTLALSAFQSARHRIAGAVGRKILPLQHEKVGLMAHAAAVGQGGGAFAEGEKIDGVEHIGFAHSVGADEAIDVGRKPEFGFRNVLIIEERELFENHGAKDMNAMDAK